MAESKGNGLQSALRRRLLMGLAGVPAIALIAMSLLGGSPTVQFNAGRPGAMRLWSAWVGAWPLLMLTLLACLVVAAVAAVVFLASCRRWRSLAQAKLAIAYLALTIVHCLFATHWVGRNFPTA